MARASGSMAAATDRVVSSLLTHANDVPDARTMAKFRSAFAGGLQSMSRTDARPPRSAGWLTSVRDVPDPVFSEEMMGVGVAIDPTEGMLVAPVRRRGAAGRADATFGDASDR